ncbi:inositol monophosphatase family protein [Acidihalobacter ferrooxydans]|uniref:inositol monophosphatase family protein n=1 Tax=Acidihalobacter ferrooxydans TaxID=1765967 RepID=UPI001E484BE9|nr:inositol monophosphatase family protein [Acidihalobacter ferrooxydans]
MINSIDTGVVEALIRQVGREELVPRLERVASRFKPDGSLLTEADLAADMRVRAELAAHWPQVRMLSEEMPLAEQQAMLAEGGPVWCLDPLDGTRNFVGHFPLFSVSLALIEGGRVTFGMVYDPIRDESFAARLGGGATLNGRPLPQRVQGPGLADSLALVDFKRLPEALAAQLSTRPPYASQRYLGTCALEWAWLAAGRGHVYLHGGMRLWDYAAGSLLLAEVGGRSATLDGEMVFRLDPGPRSAVAAADPALFVEWQRELTQRMRS